VSDAANTNDGNQDIRIHDLHLSQSRARLPRKLGTGNPAKQGLDIPAVTRAVDRPKGMGKPVIRSSASAQRQRHPAPATPPHAARHDDAAHQRRHREVNLLCYICHIPFTDVKIKYEYVDSDSSRG
jgi:hypothetical protein